ncbi:hypothetical protein SANTM175S_07826 [Streptomyces antimycoticus]
MPRMPGSCGAPAFSLATASAQTRLKTASLPMATRCSFTPISYPQHQKGLEPICA